jgi:membrane associated rhomboid family serine protease
MNQFNTNKIEVFGYPILLIILMWTIFFADSQLNLELFQWGVHPREVDGLKGILFMPLIHSQRDVNHIFNNSVPTLVLMASLIYFYRKLAFRVVVWVWLGTGLLTWLGARDSYHIGMSGVIYGLVGFLFVSGAIRNYRPLMSVSLFVIFLYGSLIWGILPMQSHVSWEGHLFGLGMGVLMAFVYRKQGPQSPKYRYEIEKELGIEPEDLEEKWRQLNAVQSEEVPVIQTMEINYEFVERKQSDQKDTN